MSTSSFTTADALVIRALATQLIDAGRGDQPVIAQAHAIADRMTILGEFDLGSAALLTGMAELLEALSNPPLLAQQRWEYQFVEMRGDIEPLLNENGKKGWQAWAIVERKPGGVVVIAMRRIARLVTLPTRT